MPRSSRALHTAMSRFATIRAAFLAKLRGSEGLSRVRAVLRSAWDPPLRRKVMVGGGHIVRRRSSHAAFGIALLLALGGSLALAAWAPARAAAVTIDSPKDGSYTKNRTPTFSGTGLPFVPLTLSIREAGGESAAEPVTATPGAAGQWEATPEVSLSDGSYTAVAEQP